GRVSCRRADFFFSSRRRHTRFSRDWSSDVCSSDLATYAFLGRYYSTLKNMGMSMFDITNPQMLGTQTSSSQYAAFNVFNSERLRSEERRVGKECRSRGWADR